MSLPVFYDSQSETEGVSFVAHTLGLLAYFVNNYRDMAGSLSYAPNPAPSPRPGPFERCGLISGYLNDAQSIPIHEHVILGVGRGGFNHLGYRFGPWRRQQAQGIQGLIDPFAPNRIQDRPKSLGRRTYPFGNGFNSRHSLPHHPTGSLGTGHVAAIGPCGRKFAQPMTHHILGDKHGDMSAPIMDTQSNPHHFRHNH